jgi:hypothetical protein
MSARKKLGTVLGFLAPLIAVTTTITWFRLANQVALPDDRTLFVVFFLLAPTAGIAAFILGTKWYGGIAAVPGIAIGLFLPFTVYISPQQVAENPIKVGDHIPYFVAIDDQGELFESDVLKGTPVLIKFFRAHW